MKPRITPEHFRVAVYIAQSRIRQWDLTGNRRYSQVAYARPLVNYEYQLGSEADLAVPTPDHYLPLLYVAGTRTSSDPITFPVEGLDGRSVSMLSVKVG